MKKELVLFKGTKNGVYIYIQEGNFSSIKKELESKIKSSLSFFQSGQIVDIKGKKLSSSQKKELKDIIENKYKLHILEAQPKKKSEVFGGIKEGMTKFINTTIRSGQILRYDGNLVIVGDVNPGAYVVARGNIIVLGVLRGIAHAGYNGNKKAIVAAYSLQPTQLRIADIIARRPDDYKITSKIPEVARIYNGEVLIEPYLIKN